MGSASSSLITGGFRRASPYLGHLDAPALMTLDHFETVLTPVGEEAMAWNIGDAGFEMVLGTYVPHIIDEHIVGAESLPADSRCSVPYGDIRHWAIHPGRGQRESERS